MIAGMELLMDRDTVSGACIAMTVNWDMPVYLDVWGGPLRELAWRTHTWQERMSAEYVDIVFGEQSKTVM